MEIVLIIGVLAGMIGAAVQAVRANQYSEPQALPAPKPKPAPKAPIEGYHTLAEIWDYTLSGAGVPSPAADTQYAVKEPRPAHPRPPAGGTGVSSPVKQSFGHYGFDFPSTITAAKITADRIHVTNAEIASIRGKIDELEQSKDKLAAFFTSEYAPKPLVEIEDSYSTRTLECDAYVRASPYRKSDYVRIAEAWEKVQVIGYVHGEPFGGAGTLTDIWFVLEDESVVWSGYFTNKSSVGLYPYDVDEPEIFEQKSFSGRVVSTVTTYPTVRKPYAA